MTPTSWRSSPSCCKSAIAGACWRGSLAELKALGPEVLAADVAVLDINLGTGQPSGIEAYDWLLGQNFAGRLLFLTGHAHAHPLVARAERLNRAIVLDKPLDGQVLLDRIMGVGVGSTAGTHLAP